MNKSTLLVKLIERFCCFDALLCGRVDVHPSHLEYVAVLQQGEDTTLCSKREIVLVSLLPCRRGLGGRANHGNAPVAHFAVEAKYTSSPQTYIRRLIVLAIGWIYEEEIMNPLTKRAKAIKQPKIYLYSDAIVLL
jgi:hypothetical protein